MIVICWTSSSEFVKQAVGVNDWSRVDTNLEVLLFAAPLALQIANILSIAEHLHSE